MASGQTFDLNLLKKSCVGMLEPQETLGQHLDKDEVLQRKKFYSPNEALKTHVPWETRRGAAYDNKPTFFVSLQPFSRD